MIDYKRDRSLATSGWFTHTKREKDQKQKRLAFTGNLAGHHDPENRGQDPALIPTQKRFSLRIENLKKSLIQIDRQNVTSQNVLRGVSHLIRNKKKNLEVEGKKRVHHRYSP